MFVLGALGYQVRAFTPDRNVNTKQRIIRVDGATQARMTGLDSGTLYRFYVASIGFQNQASPESAFVSDVTRKPLFNFIVYRYVL